MKKILMLIVLALPAMAIGQTKIGLKFSPLITSGRPDLISDTLNVESGGASLKFGLGLIIDQSFSETYVFSTGLLIVPKRVNLDIRGENGGTFPNMTEAYNLQYLQIPLTLKLYTNEVAPDLTIFFQVGGGIDIKISENPLKEDYILVERFNPIDIMATIGAGAEYRAGINTILFGGLNYQRGLINVINETNPRNQDLTVRTSVFAIDFGIKF